MQDFQHYLEKTGEIGFVEKTIHSIVYVAGLPGARPDEMVVFEGGEMGQVLSLTPDYVEVLLLSKTAVDVGTKAARTGRLFEISVGEHLLGKTIDPLGSQAQSGQASESRPIDIPPPAINKRKNITKPLATGVTIVDLVVPLGSGQRQLVVGDRKTEKTQFLLQAAFTQARSGAVCVYGAIAKKGMDIAMIEDFFKNHGVSKNIVIVASSSSDPAGLVFLTPYTAMTIAEYFRDTGRPVLIILDDLTAHAKYYREITLLARRFPGRSSYPGDIFYIHSRLLERAGNFMVGKKEASITCLPVAELVMGDLSGYIQTNLMAMTDGHIYFDRDYYLQGRRPAINTFLSVTRVGHQAQSPLFRDLSRQLTSFLASLERLREFMHFGAELTEATRRTLALGDRVFAFFEQSPTITIPVNVNAVLLASLWAGRWSEVERDEMKSEMDQLALAYETDTKARAKVDNLIAGAKNFNELVTSLKKLGSQLYKND
jgi:F-type H+-transporting ATPase subunit alpha